LANTGAVVSSLAIFGNPLDNGPDDRASLQGWKACIDHAGLFGCDLVCGFTGWLRGRPVPDSIPRFKKVLGDLARRAADRGVRLAFENCPMGGD
jgi:sugar phosphate isomerase/epimerase